MRRGIAAALTLMLSPAAESGAYLFAGEADGVDVIAHPKPYVGTGGALSVSVCADTAGVPGSVSSAAFVSTVAQAVDVWNRARASETNIGLGADNELQATQVDLRSAVLHELGHCLGLAHPNAGSEAGATGDAANSTRAAPGLNGQFNLGAGIDGIFGTVDDARIDDTGLYWFNRGTGPSDPMRNHPLALPAVIDSTTQGRNSAALPAGQSFAANGDREVLESLGIPATESVMQELQYFDEVQRRITAEEIRALRLAQSGADRTQGNADDYSLSLNFVGETAVCDLPVRFDPISEFAQCELTANFISGNAIHITDSRVLLSPNINWFASVGPNLSAAANDTPDSSAPGQTVSVSVVVSKLFAEGPAGEANGVVEVDDGAGAQCQATLTNGNGSCNLVPLVRGTRPINASYLGNAGFDEVTASAPHTTTGPAVTSVTSASDTPATTVVGQTYVASTTISSLLGSADGTVNFSDELSGNCNATLASAGPTTASASCNLPSSQSGMRTVQMSYAGNSEFAAAQASFDHQIDKASTTVAIQDDGPDPSIIGNPVDVTIGVAVVAPGAGTPGGMVTISASPTESCQFSLPQTSCPITFVSFGARTITASYAGDGNFEAAQITAPHDVIGPAATSFSQASDLPATTVVGQPYQVSVSLDSPYGAAAGNVSFTDDLAGTCNGALTPTSATSSTATCQLASVQPGNRVIQVDFPGSSNFAAAHTTVDHVIVKAATSVQITGDDPDPSLINTSVSVSFAVAATAPGAGQPSGTIRISASGTEFCDAVLPTLSCSLQLTSTGNRTLTAAFPGDARFEPSQGTDPHLVVGPNIFQSGFEN